MAKITGLFLNAETRETEVREYGDFKDMQDAVGGFIEVLPAPGGQLLIFEEIKFHPHHLNEIGCALMHGRMFSGDYVAGNAILIGPTVKGEFTSVTPEQLEMVKIITGS